MATVWGAVLNQVIFYAGFGIAISIIGIVIYVLLYMNKYKYKLTYWDIVGDVNKGNFTVDRVQKNRIKWSKDGNSWELLYPLFKGKKIQPFDTEFIYPNKQIYAFKINNTFIPAKMQVDDATSLIKPIPFHTRNWHKIELLNNETEFATHSWWDNNKFFIMTILTVAICCGLAGVTIYYALKFTSGISGDLRGVADALRGVTTMGGKPPA